jgi:hypothetical protein
MTPECLATRPIAASAAADRDASASSWPALPSALHLLHGCYGCMLLICAVTAAANLLAASGVFGYCCWWDLMHPCIDQSL